jgi:hypothetical protein
MGADRRSRSQGRKPQGGAVKRGRGPQCPQCSRDFLIGPDFVWDVVVTGRTWPSGRAEVRCGICGHVWWSQDVAVLKRAREIARSRGATTTDG